MSEAATNSNLTIDDHVDDEIAVCLDLKNPRSFFLFAGAGSGKTRSLVNALDHVLRTQGEQLSLRGQRVAVITYTNAACDEINRRIKFNPIFQVSTIHSFAWSLIEGFNSDIRDWLRMHLTDEIAEIGAAEAKGRAGTKASLIRRSQIEAKHRRLARLGEIRSFVYSPTGENGEPNSLNHAEVISLAAYFLIGRPTMQRLLVNQFPFLLIDESQDTNKHLVDALLSVEAAHRERFALGLLGDTMQRIYNDGKDRIEDALPEAWAKPSKRLNHRSPQRVIRLINRIRGDVDHHTQDARSDSYQGWIRLFVFPSDDPDKPLTEDKVRAHMAATTGDVLWLNRARCKLLALEHHMAAKRMGFEKIYEPLHSIDSFGTGLLDGSLPATRLFTQLVLPLVISHQAGDKFAVARIVRENSPLLDTVVLRNAADPRQQLQAASAAVDHVMGLFAGRDPSCGDILRALSETRLFAIPESLKPLVEASTDNVPASDQDDADDPLSGKLAALEKFLEAPFSCVQPYAEYVDNKAPFGTHQGVKGLEFDRVLVLMDDAEARGFLFGYEKLFGAKEPSTSDIRNERDGKETTLNRTRRLLYVTCSRACRSLALVVYTANVSAVRDHAIANDWFAVDEVITSL